MNAQTPNSQLSYQLPSMSYIDASWEEPTLRATPANARSANKHGFANWLAARIAAFRSWRQEQRARTELHAMTDRELLDIGVSRADFGRMFSDAHNQDLRARGTAV
ncbi:MAG: hypothetical protein B7Z80_11565 [Rhodospirillales bacterium 20-64-7]|nr:MAG: hypothetical protein B7Z80_11565 [Rhodospirillales bacterium 20-64-7]HQT77941.1 DUF1127 domain-containing protein [Rhodopila sp.]